MIGCTLGLPCFSCRRQENIFLSIRKKECLKGRYSRLWRRRRHRAKYVSFHLHVCLMLIMCSDRAGQIRKQCPEKEAAIEFIIWHFIFTREEKAVISEWGNLL